MSISCSWILMSTDGATMLTTDIAQHADVYLMPTSSVWLGGTTTLTSANGLPLTTAMIEPFHVKVWPGDHLFGTAVSSSAITVAVMVRTA